MLEVDDAMLVEVARAVAAAPKELRTQIRKGVTGIREPWRAEVSSHVGEAGNPKAASKLIAQPTRVQVSDNRIRVHVSSGSPKLRGGMNPREHGRAVEFGSNGKKTKTYTSNRRGTSYQIKGRRTNAQLMPRRARGAVFYEAGREMIPRAYSLWAQTTFRTIAEALEGKA